MPTRQQFGLGLSAATGRALGPYDWPVTMSTLFAYNHREANATVDTAKSLTF